jgi:hypothetical protein
MRHPVIRGVRPGQRAFDTSLAVLALFPYGWMPHNAGFGFLDRPRGVLGQIHF